MTGPLRSRESAVEAPARRAHPSREAGFTLIDMLFVVGLIGPLSSLAVPGLVRARGAAQATSAIGSLGLVNSGELSYAITCGLGFYAPDLPTLGIPSPGMTEAFLPAELTQGATVIKSGFILSLAGTVHPSSPATCNGVAPGGSSASYAAVADPIDLTGQTPRFFGTNSDGLIYEDGTTLSLTMPETGSPPSGHPIR